MTSIKICVAFVKTWSTDNSAFLQKRFCRKPVKITIPEGCELQVVSTPRGVPPRSWWRSSRARWPEVGSPWRPRAERKWTARSTCPWRCCRCGRFQISIPENKVHSKMLFCWIELVVLFVTSLLIDFISGSLFSKLSRLSRQIFGIRTKLKFG